MIETFPHDSQFLTNDSRKTRWAVPYNHECLNSRVENIIIRNKHIIEGKRILDLGCHFGTFSYAVLTHGANYVYGIDSEEKLISEALQFFKAGKIDTNRYRFQQGDIISILEKMTPGEFDTILCLGIFYYVNDPLYLLRLMKKVAKNIIIDTFTAYYAAVVSKDGTEIAQYTLPETFNLPIVVYPMTQAQKKDYTLKHTFRKKDRNKPLSLLTLPTLKAMENFLNLCNLQYRVLPWDAYVVNNYQWQDFINPGVKKSSHWADIYHSKIRVSYLIEQG
ncbi:MAG: SAM-dependent methyltransferase [Candidatus Margulisiibacteriota bacterium]|nr:MAG: hypothetical protein A2X43_12175 [Candidatus Margulisbacteria bacterium GWD2_39_127]OGI03213.1 MAG: hypothetical protein A2X42_11415 [Candidatus Margulisbacteria bacterium GWF2_38_17]OGI11237.1 MAG: hypothetical protein A2X41_03840 [Candidatus Margulisbacteria bacterium GWE2_39_32]PZM78548.1 MAG: SAM-dependent methyltransferase [Candidatus Margulisiibacteriota bacterium]HAR63885.1 SAM-dependent methyltransferase [Candidatus Margulisiibacteriota bacterium]